MTLMLTIPGTDNPAEAAGRIGLKTPVRQFCLFPYGTTQTSKGELVLDAECAQEVMRRYQEYTAGRGGWLDIDYGHLSQTNEDDPEAGVSAGKFKLELRDDGLWVTDIHYTDRAWEKVATEEYRYYSPVVQYDKGRRLVEVSQLGLTNIPAIYGTPPLALSVTAKQSWPIDEGVWDADKADARVRKFCGSKDGSLEGVNLTKYAKFFAFVGDPEKPSTWKAPIGDIRDGKPVIVKRAVQALAAAIQGARGGIAVPAEELPKLKSLVERYYAQWDATVPWSKEEKMSKFNRVLALSILFGGQVEASQELLEAKPGMKNMLEALYSALMAAHPGTHLEDIYEGYAVLGMEGPGIVEKYMKVPYELKDGVIQLGAAVPVVKSWAEGSNASAEELSKAKAVEGMLLSTTGKTSLSAALSEIERLRGVEQSAQGMSGRLEKLEQQNFDVRRTAMLSDAKSAGKWTSGMEQLADRAAERARKLGEDPIQAFGEVFSMAPTVVDMSSPARPPETPRGAESDGTLTAEEEAACQDVARINGLAIEAVRTQYLSNRRMYTRR